MGAYLIPQAMAYGSLAGVSPSTSLTIAAVPLVVYMLLGRTPYMSLGPESTVALMAASVVAYSLVLGVQLPALWLDPLGGLAKNLVILPALAVLWVVLDRR